jgi:Toprim domain/CHC2 zinc finger
MPAPQSAFREFAQELRRPKAIPDEAWRDLWAEAKNVDMVDLAQGLGVRLKQQGPHWVGPCPAGCARTDGFIVTPAKRLFFCRPSETRGDAIDLAVHALGCSKTEALEYVTGRKPSDAPVPKPAFRPAKEAPPPRPLTSTADALALFREGRDPRGTLAEKYLNQERRLDLPVDLCGEVLRWHPGAQAMLTLYRNVMTGEAQAVQRTYLSYPDAKKTGRKFIGPSGGAAAMLDPFAEVTWGLHVGEGVETCMAARQLGLRPAWALGSKDQIAAFPVLAGIGCLTLLQENDGGKSDAACEKCAQRWHDAGREVIIVTPNAGKDLNDAFKDRAS